MTITPSRLLTRLDADIAAATDLVTADCLRAERAAYIARQGHLAEAQKELEAIRQRHSRNPVAAVSAWVSLAEGILVHFESLSSLALDKIKRAYALSVSAGIRRSQTISAAWLSHLEYLALNVELAIKYLRASLESAGDDCHEAVFRSNMVLGMLLHLSGQTDFAARRYEIARREAVIIGDAHSIGALMHNVGWLWAYGLRAHFPEGSNSAARHAKLATQSSFRFDEFVGTTGLMSLQPLLRGFVSTALGDFGEAVKYYGSALSLDGVKTYGTMKTVFQSDYVWCLLNLDRREEALAELARFDMHSINDQEPDDRAMTQERFAQIYQLLGQPDLSLGFDSAAQTSWQQHDLVRHRIRACLMQHGLYCPPEGSDSAASASG